MSRPRYRKKEIDCFSLAAVYHYTIGEKTRGGISANVRSSRSCRKIRAAADFREKLEPPWRLQILPPRPRRAARDIAVYYWRNGLCKNVAKRRSVVGWPWPAANQSDGFYPSIHRDGGQLNRDTTVAEEEEEAYLLPTWALVVLVQSTIRVEA